jgi:hypothetical protein
MTTPRASQQTITQVIDVLQWTLSGDDAVAAEETRRQCRLAGPYCAGYLIGVVRGFVATSGPQRIRSANTLMEGGGYIKSTRTEEFGVSRDRDEAGDADGRDKV